MPQILFPPINCKCKCPEYEKYTISVKRGRNVETRRQMFAKENLIRNSYAYAHSTLTHAGRHKYDAESQRMQTVTHTQTISHIHTQTYVRVCVHTHSPQVLLSCLDLICFKSRVDDESHSQTEEEDEAVTATDARCEKRWMDGWTDGRRNGCE